MSAKKRLGRGLDALLGGSDLREAVESPQNLPENQLKNLPVDLIQRGKYQPRREMEQEALEELAASIRVQGVMQPIVVRSVSKDRYEIIAGERRWRASQLAGKDTIPAIIREVPDETAIAMALIENIQRENLNPLEEATSLDRLRLEFELTQQEVADAVGKSRATVANLLRLLALNEDVKTLLERGDIEMGHARALLGLSGQDQSATARSVAGKGLTVRQTEALVRKLNDKSPKSQTEIPAVDPDLQLLERQLGEKIGAPVSIKHGSGGKGKLVLSYSSLDELEGILSHIK
ncbi:MAG: ParB/RepB/Spo0J family partition protein [Pseudomonadales bacterium]